MKILFAATQHYVVNALRDANVVFPTTKKNIIAKAGKASIRLDWDKYTTLEDYCKNVKLEKYENKSQFFNALLGTHADYNAM